ncbi:MAG: DUF1641 domain-containing protein [Myxococcota bacterium]
MDTETIDLTARLDRLEKQVGRILDLLEARPSALDEAARGASMVLDETFGKERTRQHLTEMLIRIAEPETAEALVRVAELAPQLELGLHAVAAGPAVLEEAMETARQKLGRTLDPATRDRRVQAALGIVESISGEAELAALQQLTDALPALAPLVQGAGEALHARSEVEGDDVLSERAAQLVLSLSDPETTGALVRIADLAPQLEYAAQFAAAGPALLEEGMDMVRAQLATAEGPLNADQALDVLRAVGRPDVLRALESLARAVPRLEVATAAAARGIEQHVALEGSTAVGARVEYAVQEILHPEVLDALVRLAQLAPQLEYAAQFAAAGPALLEEGMDMARKWSAKNIDGAPVEARVERALGVLAAASDPRRLDALELIVRRVETLAPLADALGDPEAVDALRRLIQIAPNLAAPLEALPIQERTLEVLRIVNQAVEEAASEKSELGAFGLLGALGNRDVKRAAGFGIGVAKRLGYRLDSPQALPDPSAKNSGTNGTGH